MSKKKKVSAFLFLMAVLIAPATIKAVAASVSFNDFRFVTIPYSESYEYVVSKEKADNEQNWYLTITEQSGLGSTSQQNRAFAVSAKNDTEARGYMPLGLYTNSVNQKLKYGYPSYFNYPKGTRCRLYFSGNNNSSGRYTITLSGRYTS